MKVFYAHPASISPQGIEEDTQRLKEALELKYQRFFPGRHVRVRSGRSDHHSNYSLYRLVGRLSGGMVKVPGSLSEFCLFK